MNPIKVLVVDDSAFMRKIISDIINKAPGLEAVGTARNGSDALEKIKILQPDVLILDIEMPVMNGIATLEKIMSVNPIPVIMLSSLTRDGAAQTLKALEMGAVDFIAKPSGQISLDIEKVEDQIINKIKAAAAMDAKSLKLERIDVHENKAAECQKSSKPDIHSHYAQLKKLVLIGTSTGGPRALQKVITKLPHNIDAAVLVVQHMPAGFTKSLAERLDSLSNLRVKEAEHGEKLIPGYTYIAPGNYHMRVKSSGKQEKSLNIVLDQDIPKGRHRPSVDVMLKSVAEQFWGDMVCVIMTGMGNDGAEGVREIKARNGKIIIENESSCIVYGMPKAALETGAVDKVVPLDEIADTIRNVL